MEETVRLRTRALENAKDIAEAASIAKSDFLANMSHELRTPLHVILSFAEFGVTKAGKVAVAKTAGYFERILSSGQVLLKLVDSVLDLSKLEAGRVRLQLERTGILNLAHQFVSEFDHIADDSGVEIVVRYDGGDMDDPGPTNPEPKTESRAELWAELDPDRFSQLVRNLVSNALKFSTEGTPSGNCVFK